jgi:hypothetical protein
MSVSELVDGAVRLLKRDFGRLVRLSAIFVIPVQVLSTALALTVLPTHGLVIHPDGSIGEGYYQTHAASSIFFVTLARLFLLFAVSALCAGAIAAVVAARYTGRADPRVDAEHAARFATTRALPLLGVALLTFLGTVAAGVACGLPGIYLWITWTVAMPALVIEGMSPTRALGRSFALVRHNWWRTFGFTLLVAVLTNLSSLVLTIPLGVLVSTNRASGVVLAGVARLVVGLVVIPFAAVSVVLFYFDLRVRKEAFDIELLVESLDRPRGAVAGAATTSGAPRPPRATAVTEARTDDGPASAPAWGSAPAAEREPPPPRPAP